MQSNLYFLIPFLPTEGGNLNTKALFAPFTGQNVSEVFEDGNVVKPKRGGPQT